jgi:hypothetical protein
MTLIVNIACISKGRTSPAHGKSAAVRMKNEKQLKGCLEMAVFRVEKSRDYTVMSNHHLKNKALSLKAKGLLSQMLSLPEGWDYTLKGLSFINRESVDAIRTAVWELETAGYIVRQQGRDAKGKMTAIEYIIYEQPQSHPAPAQKPELDSPLLDSPILENPTPDNPTSGNPVTGKPTSENPTQLNTKVINTYPVKNQKSNIHPSNPDQIRIDPMQMEHWRREIRRRIDYYSLLEDTQESDKQLDEIVELMVEIQCATKPKIHIASNDYPTELVKERFSKIGCKHIQYVTDSMRQNKTRIRNIKQYLMTTLFNATATVESYYSAEFNHFYLGPGAKE